MKDQVAIIGVGCTKFGDQFDQSYEDLVVDAAAAAFTDAGIQVDRIDARKNCGAACGRPCRSGTASGAAPTGSLSICSYTGGWRARRAGR